MKLKQYKCKTTLDENYHHSNKIHKRVLVSKSPQIIHHLTRIRPQQDELCKYKCDGILKNLSKIRKLNLPVEKYELLFKQNISKYIRYKETDLQHLNLIGKQLISNGVFIIEYTELLLKIRYRSGSAQQIDKFKMIMYNTYEKKINSNIQMMKKYFQIQKNQDYVKYNQFFILNPKISVRTPIRKKLRNNSPVNSVKSYRSKSPVTSIKSYKTTSNIKRYRNENDKSEIKRSAPKSNQKSISKKKSPKMIHFLKYVQQKGLKISPSIENIVKKQIETTAIAPNINIAQIILNNKQKQIMQKLNINRVLSISDVYLYLCLNKNFNCLNKFSLCLVKQKKRPKSQLPLLAIINLKDFQKLEQTQINKIKNNHQISLYLKSINDQQVSDFLSQQKKMLTQTK